MSLFRILFSDLVWRSGAEWFIIDIDHGLLPHVDPDNLARLGINLATGLVESIFKSRDSWLSAAVDLVPGNTAEVGDSGHWLGQLLDLLKMIRLGK